LKRRTALAILGSTLAATACTPQQIADWASWHEKDPLAAEEFASLPGVQEHLRLDTDQDGVVEPDASDADESAPARSALGGGTVWDRLAQF
jgi:ferric-dicitrate binding protein FerR (iron transport regulator)